MNVIVGRPTRSLRDMIDLIFPIILFQPEHFKTHSVRISRLNDLYLAACVIRVLITQLSREPSELELDRFKAGHFNVVCRSSQRLYVSADIVNMI